MKKVELDGYSTRKISELSGGEKQRVAIARALIKKTKIVIADEPTGSLDDDTAEQIFSLLKELSKKCLVIVVTHSKKFAEKYADKLISINNGEVECIEKKNSIHMHDLKQCKNNKCGSISFLTSFKIGLSYLKLNFTRLFILVILATFSLTCFGISISAYIYDKDDVVVNNIVANDFVDPLTISCNYQKNDSIIQQTTIKPSFISKMNSDLNFNFFGVYS